MLNQASLEIPGCSELLLGAEWRTGIKDAGPGFFIHPLNKSRSDPTPCVILTVPYP